MHCRIYVLAITKGGVEFLMKLIADQHDIFLAHPESILPGVKFLHTFVEER